VLCGECGCGKTELIRSLCEWLRIPLITLDIHGGTTEQEIIAIFEDAEAQLAAKATNAVYIFLDEINTCGHMGLLCEAICSRSLHGRLFHPGIQLLCALNPYRRRTDNSETPGLVFQSDKRQRDDMQSLVYRVHPVPLTLQDFMFGRFFLIATFA
jgi:hypothetical protein